MRAPPLLEQLGDVAVEALIRMACRLGDEAFSLAACKRGCNLLSVSTALVPVEQQAAAGVRMWLTKPVDFNFLKEQLRRLPTAPT